MTIIGFLKRRLAGVEPLSFAAQLLAAVWDLKLGHGSSVARSPPGSSREFCRTQAPVFLFV